MPDFSPEFRAWFRDSKVVDADGNPLVVYHGTKADFRVFRQSEDPERMNIGFHFGSTREQAGYRLEGGGSVLEGGGRVLEFYLRLENPLVLPDLGGWEASPVYSAFEEHYGKGASRSKTLQKIIRLEYEDRDEEALDLARSSIQKAGYDGIVYENAIEGAGPSYIVFEPSQIKSATGNDGTWDADDPDIRSNPPEAVVEVGGQQHVLKPMAAFYGWPGKVWTRMVTQDPYTWQAGALVLFYGELREAYVSSDISASDARRQVIRRVLGDLR